MVRLRTIPRASARSSQACDNLHKILIGGTLSLVYAHSGHQHGRPVIVMWLPVQFTQGNGACLRTLLRGIFKEIHGHLIVKQVAQPKLDIGSQVTAIDFRDHLRAIRLHTCLPGGKRRHRAHVLGVHAVCQHSAGGAVRQRHAPFHTQRHIRRQGACQRTDRRVIGRFADCVTDRAVFPRQSDQPVRCQHAQLIKILTLLIQRIKRFKADAPLAEQLCRAVHRGAQHKALCLKHGVKRAKGDHFPAVRPQRRYGYDMLIHG